MDTHGTVVVGIDGSEPSLAAARVAAEEARRRSAPLRVVCAYPPPGYFGLAAGPMLGLTPQTIADSVVQKLSHERDLPEHDVEATGSSAWRVLDVKDTIAHDVARDIEAMVVEALAGEPDLPKLDVRAVAGSPWQVLIEAASDADLLVVGHRGRGGLSSALLGSVSLQCVIHAPCSVLVVRDPAE